MMRKLRDSILTRLFCGLLGLYFLNLSVDAAYPSPNHIPDFTYFNDQESIIEIVVEQVIGLEDYFEELDNPESETQFPKRNIKSDLKLNLPVWTEFFTSNQTGILEIDPITEDAFLTQSYPQIDPPPPKFQG